MAKLIYAKSKAGFNSAKPNLPNVDKSLAFMEDGWMHTHGTFFRLHPEDWSLTATASGATVTVKDGDNTVFTFNRGVASITASDFLTSATSNGAVTIKHNTITGGAAVTVGPEGNGSSTIIVPQITFDKYGHYNSVENRSARLDYVLSSPIATSANQYLVGAPNASQTRAALNKVSTIFFNADTGTLNATVFKQNGKTLTDLYAPKSHTTVKATGSTLGHVTLSDSIESTSAAGNGVAATPNAVKQVYDYAKSILSAGDAMLFMGLITTGAKIEGISEVNGETFTSLKNYKAGWTFKVKDAQSIAGLGALEVGDMIIAINSNTTYAVADWTVVQADIDGAVTAGGTLTSNRIVLGSGSKSVKVLAAGTTGQVLQSGGTSTPTWTNKWYRGIQVNDGNVFNNITAGTVNFKNGAGISMTNSSGTVTVATNLHDLTIGDKVYKPASGAQTITSDRGIRISGGAIGHSNSISAQSGTALRAISYDAHGHITGSEIITALPTPNKLTFSDGKSVPTTIDFDGSAAKNIKFLPESEDVRITAAVSGNDLTYTVGLTHRYRAFNIHKTAGSNTNTAIYNDTTAGAITLKAGTNVSLRNSGGTVTITATDTNTWRDVTLRTKGSLANAVSIGQKTLKFGQEFHWEGDEVKLGWAEVAANGTITYEY